MVYGCVLQISRVTTQFQQLQDKLEGERQLRVLHGGVMLDTRRREPEPRLDPMEAFKVLFACPYNVLVHQVPQALLFYSSRCRGGREGRRGRS